MDQPINQSPTACRSVKIYLTLLHVPDQGQSRSTCCVRYELFLPRNSTRQFLLVWLHKSYRIRYGSLLPVWLSASSSKADNRNLISIPLALKIVVPYLKIHCSLPSHIKLPYMLFMCTFALLINLYILCPFPTPI